jgi:polyferredoxin
MKQQRFALNKLIVPGVIMFVFLAVGYAMWQSSGYIAAFLFFGYIGASLGIGLGLYATLPRKSKPRGRRLTLFLVGLFLFFGAAILGQENMQIEGAFFGLLTGVIQAAVIHYLIAKIAGPVLFGRLWCGWACWTAMILDLLPFTCSPGRLPGRWGWLRYLHFLVSLGLVLALWFGLSYGEGVAGPQAVIWFLAGNGLYYALGIGLAYLLRDNRAFCKYACPITLPLKITSRFSLLKIRANKEQCTGCGTCSQACPVDIRIPEYTQQGKRVLSTECLLCQTCTAICPQGALRLSFGFDVGGLELLRVRVPIPLHRDDAGGETKREIG